ncbi:pilus assembly protein [Methylovirgula ligni]|uniref:Tight adherence protein B n=1 Tax=Methylovirgula ligni TaxID=569860 RepID=A0A3D9Z0S7_9HYPH|nr:type II secretion system F family protein [Methylovirgula ligni]QAY94527.1 pilus assembly protein [Methylovirgula ligni]REF87610.1 tight adherence protein B [Methylovirgula ligni]
MPIQALLSAFLAALAVGGFGLAFVYPLLSGERQAEKRQAALSASAGKQPEKQTDAAVRRKQIADSLKEIERRNTRKRVSLETKISRAGLRISKSVFFIYSAISGLVLALLFYVLTGKLYLAAAAGLVGAIGLPTWVINYLAKKRLKKFVNLFPDTIDVIVRGVKAGLPLGDCLRIIASEVEEPVRGEFRAIVEAATMGLSISEAVERLTNQIPIAETNFFSIVINIQQKAGGNLSEALSNLSGVLRDRKMMEGKIKAFSSEAKASAMIIGSLPFAVAGLVYVTSPAYISLLWTTSTGQLVLGAAALWMAIGIFVMKKMVNFDY